MSASKKGRPVCAEKKRSFPVENRVMMFVCVSIKGVEKGPMWVKVINTDRIILKRAMLFKVKGMR